MKKPDICMITQSTFPFDPRVRREAEVLRNSGYHVDIICLRTPEQPKKESYGTITTHRVLKYARTQGIPEYIFISSCFFVVAFFRILILSLKKDYSLIQIHNMPDFLVFTAVINKLLGTPLILDIHDMTVELFETKWQGRHRLLLSCLKKLEYVSCNFANHIITVTEPCKDILVRRGQPPDKITLILNTCDPAIFKTYLDREFKGTHKKVKLLYHGTVAKRFGLHILIEALFRLKENLSNVCLSIYGKYDADYKDALMQLVQSLNLEDSVVFYGELPQEEIYEIIKESHIGVVPYVNDKYMNIALSTKAFEYVSSGLPVVASRLNCMQRVFDDKSITFFEPDNPEELASKIVELCQRPELRKKQTEYALKKVTSISWDKMAKRYLNLVEDLISNNFVSQA